MTTKDDGGPAFPRNERYADGDLAVAHQGMTLRDWFAGQALAGVLANSNDDYSEPPAKWAYAIADAMIAERNK